MFVVVRCSDDSHVSPVSRNNCRVVLFLCGPITLRVALPDIAVLWIFRVQQKGTKAQLIVPDQSPAVRGSFPFTQPPGMALQEELNERGRSV